VSSRDAKPTEFLGTTAGLAVGGVDLATLPVADLLIEPLSDALGRLVVFLGWNEYYVGVALGWGVYLLLRSKGLMSGSRLDATGKLVAFGVRFWLIFVSVLLVLHVMGFID
jgi:hypothetical protein